MTERSAKVSHRVDPPGHRKGKGRRGQGKPPVIQYCGVVKQGLQHDVKGRHGRRGRQAVRPTSAKTLAITPHPGRQASRTSYREQGAQAIGGRRQVSKALLEQQLPWQPFRVEQTHNDASLQRVHNTMHTRNPPPPHCPRQVRYPCARPPKRICALNKPHHRTMEGIKRCTGGAGEGSVENKGASQTLTRNMRAPIMRKGACGPVVNAAHDNSMHSGEPGCTRRFPHMPRP